MLILVDAMGGDNAPNDIVNGCIDALQETEGYDIMLLGDVSAIDSIIKKRKFRNPRLKVYHTSQVITNEDIPTKAIKSKKDSSMYAALHMLKERKGDVMLTAGNTGALSVGSLFILGRVEGLDRPALAPIIPSKKGPVLLIDAGLNTNCKPLNYEQFARIGSIYMKELYNIESPKVGLINVGSENNKGYENIKQAYERLSSANINFIGNIEGRQIPQGDVDVAVCDGFVGNVLLKFLEGVGSFIYEGLSGVYKQNVISKLSAAIIKNPLKKFFKKLDYEEYGGTPILGVNGKVIKCHGSSNQKTIKNAVKAAYKYAKSSVLEHLNREFINRGVESIGL
ncbi:MAG: phosphate acyltransferase PlsX [Eubacteriales bacterium]|nr:phosphate acyltransferase PlsX [Eubacteriales bacterium]